MKRMRYVGPIDAIRGRILLVKDRPTTLDRVKAQFPDDPPNVWHDLALEDFEEVSDNDNSA